MPTPKKSKEPALSKGEKIPKTVKLPWNNSAVIGSSRGGELAVVSGELGAIGTIDASWKFAPWPRADGFVNSIAVTADRVAVGVTGRVRDEPHIELRDRSGAVTGVIPTRRNPRVAWSPSGDILVAVIESDAEHANTGLALLDPSTLTATHLDLGPSNSIAACFVSDERVLAIVESESRDTWRAVHIDRKGIHEEVGVIEGSAAVGSLLPLGPDRFILSVCYEWNIVDERGRLVREGAKAHRCCLDGDGFAAAYSKKVTRHRANGGQRGAHVAKKGVDGLCWHRDHLLLLQTGQVEIV